MREWGGGAGQGERERGRKNTKQVPRPAKSLMEGSIS